MAHEGKHGMHPGQVGDSPFVSGAAIALDGIPTDICPGGTTTPPSIVGPAGMETPKFVRSSRSETSPVSKLCNRSPVQGFHGSRFGHGDGIRSGKLAHCSDSWL